MNSLESLYYALGEMAYAIAKADGKVQREERDRFNKIISEEIKNDSLFDISDIIFRMLDKVKLDAQTAYDFAIKQLRLNSHYVSPALKEKFNRVIEKIAGAFPPVTKEEKQMLDRFRIEMSSIKGDPVFYTK
ncbi:MAG: tellurite resistance TerB family protein [Bacteroidia bacterium]